MRRLAFISLLLILILNPSCKFLREKGLIGKRADTMAIWKAKRDSLRVADSLKTIQSRLMAIESARLDSIRNAEQEKAVWESKHRFNVILGSFITPAYAKAFSADLTKKGYTTRIIKLEGTKFEMVSAEGFERFRDANAKLKQFQDTVSADAWLYDLKRK